MFRRILPIVAILFIVALAVSNYFNKPEEESVTIYQEVNGVYLSYNEGLYFIQKRFICVMM